MNLNSCRWGVEWRSEGGWGGGVAVGGWGGGVELSFAALVEVKRTCVDNRY